MTSTSPIHAPAIGERLGGRYLLLGHIGEGGTSRVYRAYDELLDRDVAVKVFHVADGASADRLRNLSETRLLAALNHPSLVTLFDADIDDPRAAYLVMELVDGPTLQQRIAQAPVCDIDLGAMAVELADALSVVHAAGIVHRDVKPSNVLLRGVIPSPAGRTFRATLTDFGIAQLVDATRVTAAGTVVGTAAYLAPEQVRGERLTPAADIYALGLLLLEAHTRQAAFGTGTVHETLAARLMRSPDLPGSLGYGWKSLLAAMTALDPVQRPTAGEVAERAAMIGSASSAGPVTAPVSVARSTSRSEHTTAPSESSAARAPLTRRAVSRRRRPSPVWLPVVSVSAGLVVAFGLVAAAVGGGWGASAETETVPESVTTTPPAAQKDATVAPRVATVVQPEPARENSTAITLPIEDEKRSEATQDADPGKANGKSDGTGPDTNNGKGNGRR